MSIPIEKKKGIMMHMAMVIVSPQAAKTQNQCFVYNPCDFIRSCMGTCHEIIFHWFVNSFSHTSSSLSESVNYLLYHIP